MRKLLLMLLMLPVVGSAQSPLHKLARRKAAPMGSTAFITSSAVVDPQNWFGGWLGCGFTVGGSNITVTDLGRWVISGNSLTHNLKIIDGSGTTIVSTSVNTSGEPDGYLYASCTPTVLTAGNTYYIISEESSDFWHNSATVSSTGSATVIGSCYWTGSGSPAIWSSGTYSFVPVNFKYHL